MKKKGYFFIFDAIIGLFIISLGLILILSVSSYDKPPEDISILPFDVITFFSSNKIKDINNDYIGVGGELYNNKNITNIDNSLIEQISEFYYRNVSKNNNFTLELIDKFISNITKPNIPAHIGFLIRIENDTVYNQTPQSNSFINATTIIPSKMIINSIYNETEYVGPYLVEVIAWK